MSVTYDVIENGTVVLEYWSGQVTGEDLVTHEKQHLTDPRIMPGASVLVEARQAYFGITTEEAGDLVNGLYALYRQPLKIKKCALLVNDLTYPLARAYEKSGAKHGISVIAFHALDVACPWLGLDTKLVASHLEKIRKAHTAPPQNT